MNSVVEFWITYQAILKDQPNLEIFWKNGPPKDLIKVFNKYLLGVTSEDEKPKKINMVDKIIKCIVDEKPIDKEDFATENIDIHGPISISQCYINDTLAKEDTQANMYKRGLNFSIHRKTIRKV